MSAVDSDPSSTLTPLQEEKGRGGKKKMFRNVLVAYILPNKLLYSYH